MLAHVLAAPTCPVLRIDLRHTHIDGTSLAALLATPRLRAIRVSELPLFSTHQVCLT
jgi:hypothetical protein